MRMWWTKCKSNAIHNDDQHDDGRDGNEEQERAADHSEEDPKWERSVRRDLLESNEAALFKRLNIEYKFNVVLQRPTT